MVLAASRGGSALAAVTGDPFTSSARTLSTRTSGNSAAAPCARGEEGGGSGLRRRRRRSARRRAGGRQAASAGRISTFQLSLHVPSFGSTSVQRLLARTVPSLRPVGDEVFASAREAIRREGEAEV